MGYGVGASVGTTWEFQPNWWLGASYSTEMKFSKLDDYKMIYWHAVKAELICQNVMESGLNTN